MGKVSLSPKFLARRIWGDSHFFAVFAKVCLVIWLGLYPSNLCGLVFKLLGIVNNDIFSHRVSAPFRETLYFSY